MKRKAPKRKEKILLAKRNTNSKLEDFFKAPSGNIFSPTKIQLNNSPLKCTNKKICIL